jgi:hypothetical protein
MPIIVYNGLIEEDILRRKNMIKKAVCMFGLVFAFTWQAHAVEVSVGLELGGSYNKLNTSTGYRVNMSYNERLGIMVGVPVLVSFNEYFAFGSGLRYIQKNYTLYGTDNYIDYTNGFLQIPVFTEFSFSGDSLLFFNLGITFGLWLHSDRSGYWYGGFNDSVEFDSERDNRFESTFFAGLGLRYTFFEFFTTYITAQYHYGLTDLQKDYMIGPVPRYNNTITVQLGVRWSWRSK